MVDFLLGILAYALGAVPSAYLWGRLFKQVDVRRTGSGNVGAMNVIRHVGYLPGFCTLASDLGKGALAVYLATRFAGSPVLPVLATFLVVLGHNFSVFLGFKGGKGLASLAGALLVLSPAAIPYVLGTIIALALLLRDTNTAASLGTLSLPVTLGLQLGSWFFFLVGAAISLLVLVKSRRDFRAYAQGRRKLV